MAEHAVNAAEWLTELFRVAVAAAHPETCLAPHLPALPPAPGRLILIAAGKAGGSMAEIAERHYLAGGLDRGRLIGVAVARRGYGRPLQHLQMIEAGHPMP